MKSTYPTMYKLTEYMTVVCSWEGDVIQTSSGLENLKSIFDIIDESSLTHFRSYLKGCIQSQTSLKLIRVMLNNGVEYFVNVQLYNTRKISLTFYKCDENSTKCNDFWLHTISKYDYFVNRCTAITRSISNLMENVFQKNRSDIQNILKMLCESLKIQYGMLLFHNGHDHVIFCKDNILDVSCEYIHEEENDRITFDDYKFDENVEMAISDVLHLKKYNTTFFKTFQDDLSINPNRLVYILKLEFGGQTIGYLDLIPHSNVQLTNIEIELLQSLSNILAYVIYNKCEQQEIEMYIKEKFSS